jgi:Fe-S cluster assembly iron-binding protein IscA
MHEEVRSMLQVTNNAASAFRAFLDRPDVPGTAIRIMPSTQGDGQVGITMEAVEQTSPEDALTDSEGVEVVVAPELARSLSESVLDVRETERGGEFFIRSQ